MMKATDRTVDDVLREEKNINYHLEDLEQEKRRLVRFEEETENVFGENLSQLRELENFSLNSRDREDLDNIILSYDYTRRFIVSDIDDYQETLRKHESKLYDRLEVLSRERQELYRKEEERKENAHGKNVTREFD